MASALKPACLKWLDENPITGSSDIAFVRQEENRLYVTLEEAAREAAKEDCVRRLTAN